MFEKKFWPKDYWDSDTTYLSSSLGLEIEEYSTSIEGSVTE